MMEGKYKVLEKIDEGSFGDIFAIQSCSDGLVFALKQIEYRGSIMKNEYILGEIRCLTELRHGNIIKFVEFYINSDSVELILEYAENGNLENYLRERFPLKGIFLRRFAVQILGAIDFCHSRGIAHRDLTPSNVLVTAEHVIKLADFGLAVHVVTDEGRHVLCEDYLGNVSYLAPEVLRKTPYNAIMADLWSTGMLLLYLLFGKVFFQGSVEDVYHKCREVQTLLSSFNSSSFSRTEKNIFDHLQKLLKFTPMDRFFIRSLLTGNITEYSEPKLSRPEEDVVCDMVTCKDSFRQV